MSQTGKIVASTGGIPIETITGNSGGAVSPQANNIALLGSGIVTVTGNPATHSLTVSASGTVPSSFVTDLGTAIPALGVLNIYGDVDDNIITTGAGNSVWISLSDNLNNMLSITMANSGDIQTADGAGETIRLNAYNNTTASYDTFTTLTAGLVPTMDLDDAVTKASKYIYRKDGLDVLPVDGGLGTSVLPLDGQIPIGITATNLYVPATLTAGAGIGIVNAPGSITISSAAGAFTWSEETGATIALAVDNGYICNRGSLITATLPATAALGKTIRLVGKGAGLYAIAQNAGQTIHYTNKDTTTGVGGSLTALNQYDAIELICTVADTDFTVLSSIGNFTVV